MPRVAPVPGLALKAEVRPLSNWSLSRKGRGGSETLRHWLSLALTQNPTLEFTEEDPSTHVPLLNILKHMERVK